MKNYIYSGDLVTVPAPRDVSSGDICGVGSLGGVAAYNAKTGEDLVIATKGVFDLPLKAGETTTVGADVYLDFVNKVVTTTAGALKVKGVAVTAQVANDLTVRVLLGI